MAKRTVEQCFELSSTILHRHRDIQPEATSVVISSQDEQVIPIVWTGCHYGGDRPWFLCPGCQKRVGKLHRPITASHYACRVCWDLTYRSCQQSGDAINTLADRITRLKLRLGAKGFEVAPAGPIPNKPKGMHWKTYSAILDEIVGTHKELNRAVTKSVDTMLNTLPKES